MQHKCLYPFGSGSQFAASTISIGKGPVASIGSRKERSQKIVKVTTRRWSTDERWEQEKVEESTAVFIVDIVAVVCVTVYHDVPRKGQRVRAKRVEEKCHKF